MLGKSSIKLWQRPDMTIAVDWDVKHQFKHTNLTPRSRERNSFRCLCLWHIHFYSQMIFFSLVPCSSMKQFTEYIVSMQWFMPRLHAPISVRLFGLDIVGDHLLRNLWYQYIRASYAFDFLLWLSSTFSDKIARRSHGNCMVSAHLK